MTIYAAIFYLLAILVVIVTLLAITRRNAVHSVVYLAFSFLITALLFYLLGAPLLAAFEVIIYAGAIMVLFLVIIMMIAIGRSTKTAERYIRQWVPATVMAAVALIAGVLFIISAPGNLTGLTLAAASPREFGQFLFKSHWLAIEIVSFLLFVALVGALYLGRSDDRRAEETSGNKP
jgi:NADH-quinone oxidoreductase subunit J